MSSFPKLLDAIDAKELFAKMRETKAVDIVSNNPPSRRNGELECRRIFVLEDETPGDFVRAFQEEPLLRTRVSQRISSHPEAERGGQTKEGRKTATTTTTVLLPSFLDLYEQPDSALAFEMEEGAETDVHEAKWTLQKKYGYKLATTFMPNYARAIYEYLIAEVLASDQKTQPQTQTPTIIRVLDPCAGWGDRMVGLYVSDAGQNGEQPVEYVGFDPNLALYPGYKDMMTCAMSGSLVSITQSSLVTVDANNNNHNNNGQKKNRLQTTQTQTQTQISALRLEDKTQNTTFELRAQPFEEGAPSLVEETFDVAFTSPPFFDYEVYNEDTNPQYRDWVAEFYVPLFQQTARLLKPGGLFAIYLDDTSAGSIRQFLYTVVPTICPMRLDHKIGFRGIYSGRVREILVYRN